MKPTHLVIGEEYRYLGKPVTLVEIHDGVCVLKYLAGERKDELTICEPEELRPRKTPEVTSVLPRRNAVFSEGA